MRGNHGTDWQTHTWSPFSLNVFLMSIWTFPHVNMNTPHNSWKKCSKHLEGGAKWAWNLNNWKVDRSGREHWRWVGLERPIYCKGNWGGRRGHRLGGVQVYGWYKNQNVSKYHLCLKRKWDLELLYSSGIQQVWFLLLRDPGNVWRLLVVMTWGGGGVVVLLAPNR